MDFPANTGLYSGIGLCAAAGLRCAGAAMQWWNARRRERREFLASLQEFEDQLDACRPPPAPSHVAWKGYRRFVVQRIVAEADDIRSIYLAPEDRRGLPAFRPGQFLTLRLTVPGMAAPLVRCYSLSDRPRADHYRITVKAIHRDPELDHSKGKASRFLNRGVRPGDVLEAQAPRGEFFLREGDARAAVLVAAGIGITPLLSMTSALLNEPGERAVVLFYGVRNSNEHAFRERLRDLAAEEPRFTYFPCYSQPLPADEQPRDYLAATRVDAEMLRRVLPDANFPFYVCGPGPFMQGIVDGLREWGVADADLHYEAFGPSTVKRHTAALTEAVPAAVTANVQFQQSNIAADGSSDSTLLELAETAGVNLSSGCRAGNCGTCAIKLLAGKVRYNDPPAALIDPGFCLACVARPDSPQVVLDA